jgi:LmbE family N-acetylglucosaminyl deacetylase
LSVSTLRHVLVIAAHPDDEILGCGATLVKHLRRGDRVTVVIACEGASLRFGDKAAAHREQVYHAAKIMGVTDLRLLGFEDQKLEKQLLTDVIKPLEKVVAEVQPAIVYCQHGGDVNRDHRILFEAALVATRPTVASIEAIYAFDTASSTEWAYPRTFVPDTWVDVSDTLSVKLKAMACYPTELREYPHPRSLKALEHRALAWGNQVCLAAAETFMTIRRVERDA